MSRIVVAGAIANKAGNAGEAWVRATWVRALTALGHDVSMVEVLRSADTDSHCTRVRWFDDAAAWFGFGSRATLLTGDRPGAAVLATMRRQLDEADLLVDISGHLAASGTLGADLVERCGTTLFVDLDPGYTQVWHEQGIAHARLGRHTHHATIGLRVGQPGCGVPDAGVTWLAVPPFVHLPDWPVIDHVTAGAAFTTVSTWRNPFGPLEWDGVTHPGKHQTFRRYRDLPSAVPELHLEIAAHFDAGDAADRSALAAAGWRLADPHVVCDTPASFRHYVQQSFAEFSVAQGAYRGMCTGWLSDRTVKYLASGRPAVVEDTGLDAMIPTGEGLVTFDDFDGAVVGLRSVADVPRLHARAARRLAEQYFSGDVVLPPLLRACGVTSS